MAKRRSILFGQAGDLHPAVGVGLTVGVGTGTAIAVRQLSGHDKWSEAIGGGVGLLASGALMLSDRTRSAGVVGAIAVLMNNGLRFAEALLSPKQKHKDLTGKIITHTASRADGAVSAGDQYAALSEQAKVALAGFGIVSAQQVPTLGAVSASRMPTLGAQSAAPMPTLGDVQAEPRQLAGALPTFQGGGNAGVNIVGGLGANYGATIMG